MTPLYTVPKYRTLTLHAGSPCEDLGKLLTDQSIHGRLPCGAMIRSDSTQGTVLDFWLLALRVIQLIDNKAFEIWPPSIPATRISSHLIYHCT